MINISEQELLTRKTRVAILEALHTSGGGHYGGSLSVVDILHSLYRNRNLEHQKARGDKLILSKGHAAIALYATQKTLGLIESDLALYGTFGSGMEGHPDMLASPHVHFSTGSLGQGLAVGLGMAIALREERRHVWVVIGDGECQEGQIWEACMLAARYHVSNLHAIVDCNGAQECGWRHDENLECEPLPQGLAKWSAFGWSASEIDGHNHLSLDDWILKATLTGRRPSVALARTRKGRGVRIFEDAPEKYHCRKLSEDEIRQARIELEYG